MLANQSAVGASRESVTGGAFGLTNAFGSGALSTACTFGWCLLGPTEGDKDLGEGGGIGGALDGGGGGAGFLEDTLDEAAEGPGLSTTRSEAVELA